MKRIVASAVAAVLWGAATVMGAMEVSVERAAALYEKTSKEDPWEKTHDASSLAWGESHELHAIMDLYEASGDVKYLREVGRRGERMLSHRDDVRGVVDGSGKSRPAWSMGSKYVVAEGWLKDGAGKKVVRVRSTASAFNLETKVEVVEVSEGRFTLRVSNGHFKRVETFAELTAGKGDAAFITKIVNTAAPSFSPGAGTFRNGAGVKEEGAGSSPWTSAGSGSGGRATGRGSELVRIESVEEGAAGLAAQSVTLEPIPLAYDGYLGVIYHPLMRFAEVVKSDEKLRGELGAVAERFVKAAEESYADAQRLWRDGPKEGEGYYLTCEYGESFPFDNVGEPLNYLGRHAAVQFALARLTGKKDYRERAARMARLMKNRLTEVEGAYVWNYWYEPVTTTGWKAEEKVSYNIPVMRPAAHVEDVSHGVLDVAMVAEAWKAGVVFDDGDVKKFARTLVKNVVLKDRSGVARGVDGKGEAPEAYARALGGWLVLSEADAEVYRVVREVYEKRGVEDFRWLCALVKWEKRLGAR